MTRPDAVGAQSAPPTTRGAQPVPPTTRDLAILLVVSLALFTANMWGLSLISIDDATYARTGIEVGRSHEFFNPTWNGKPEFHKPPLQFWLLGRAFALFGENDFAARLPSVVMALGVLAMTYRLGALTVGAPAAAASIALLLLSPYFTDHARRVMLEVPLTFWTTLAMLVFLEGVRRPRVTVLLAVPLGAAILTRSVLGVVPVLAIFGIAAFVPVCRPCLKRPWLWMGIGLGLALGATWSLNQLSVFGWPALHEHFLVEVGSRSVPTADPLSFLMRYPWILIDSYQLVIFPAVLGAVMLWRHRAALGETALVPAIWAFVPLLALNVLSGRSPRYIFQLFPALALCGGFWLAHTLPTVARVSWRWIAPAVVAALAIILWTSPALLRPLHQSAEDPNREIKRSRALLQQIVPADESVAFVGHRYWATAAPLLYYTERRLDPPVNSVGKAVERAGTRRSRLLLCERRSLGDIDQAGIPYRIVFAARDWVLVTVL